MEKEALKTELKLLLKQFIEHLNQNGKDYFNEQIDEIVERFIPLIVKEETENE